MNKMKDLTNKSLKAMIMAAGVGSRLDPLTQTVPKPLVPVCNRPVIDILLEKLANIGVKDVIANTYYLAEKIIDYCKNNKYGINFDYIKEETLSGTAGGLKKCQYFFNKGEDFLVLSADGLSDADIKRGFDIHKRSGAIATIGIKKIPREEVSHFGVVVTDENGFIKEFQEKPAIEDAKSNYINTGIYIFNYEIFKFIPENTFYDFAKNVFPELLKFHKINTFEINDYWTDIGTLEQYMQSMQDLFNGKCHFKHEPITRTPEGAYINAGSLINDVKFVGNNTIGANCKIGKNVTLKNSIIWDNVIIGDNVVISDSVVASGCTVNRNLTSVVAGAEQVFERDITTTEKLLLF